MSANRRDAIRMSDSAADEFIDAQKNVQVGTIERDGSVHLSTLWFARIDGQIAFETYSKSQKIRNLERDPRITLLLEDGLTYEALRGVMIKGTARLTSDPGELGPIALAVMRRSQPGIPEELMAQAVEHMAAKRTAVIVEAKTIISWDHTLL